MRIRRPRTRLIPNPFSGGGIAKLVFDPPLNGRPHCAAAGDEDGRVPEPSALKTADLAKVRVNRKAADRAASGHPWIFSSDVTDRGAAKPGDAVLVIGPGGGLIGVAHYSSTSQITLRLLAKRAETIDREFFKRRLSQALAHRQRIVENSDAYRLVFSEADLLPGLIVDRYGPYLVMQALSQGMDRESDVIAACLTDLLQPAGILARNDATVRGLEGLPLETRLLAGEVPERVGIAMNGLKLEADLRGGQKTGAYLDQRENYLAVAKHAHGRVLDCFTSAGGFALHAAALGRNRWRRSIPRGARLGYSGGEREGERDRQHPIPGGRRMGSTSVAARKPVFDDHSGPAGIREIAQAGRRAAARGYKDINLARRRWMLEPGGILATCSCSHHFSEAMLLETFMRRRPRNRENAASFGAPHASARSPDSAHRTRNALP